MNNIMLAIHIDESDKNIQRFLIVLIIVMIAIAIVSGIISLISSYTAQVIKITSAIIFIVGNTVGTIIIMSNNIILGIICMLCSILSFAIVWGFGCIIEYLKQLRDHFIDKDELKQQKKKPNKEETEQYSDEPSAMDDAYAFHSKNTEDGEQEEIEGLKKINPKKVLYSENNLELIKRNSKIIFRYRYNPLLPYVEYELKSTDSTTITIVREDKEFTVQNLPFELYSLISHYEKDDYNWAISPKEFCADIKRIITEEMEKK